MLINSICAIFVTVFDTVVILAAIPPAKLKKIIVRQMRLFAFMLNDYSFAFSGIRQVDLCHRGESRLSLASAALNRKSAQDYAVAGISQYVWCGSSTPFWRKDP
ncbi:MAG: hypothetical protein ACRC0C_17035 [Gibbsiella quercinecans]|uniref:hypothetical protein n=1 Tax=Gibbsiella quercinecans TaxID=929813 RepID=UPI003F351F9F